MAANMLDLRGFSCPIPLIKTRDALEKQEKVTVLIDEPAARENIIKFAKSRQYKVDASAQGSDYTLVIEK